MMNTDWRGQRSRLRCVALSALILMGAVASSGCTVESMSLPECHPTLSICGDSGVDAPEDPRDEPHAQSGSQGSSESSASSGVKHWPREVRAVGIDRYDLVVYREITDVIEEHTSTIVINVPLLDPLEHISGSLCDPEYQSRLVGNTSALVDEVPDESRPRMVVQVNLFRPNYDDVLRVCMGADYADPYVSSKILELFTLLAEIERIDAVVVGLELNRYEEMNRSDFDALVRLYHDIYAQLSPSVSVGPSISWPLLKLETTPRVAEELNLEEDDPAALQEALRRSVWRFLSDESTPRADFVGVTLIAQTERAPYFGSSWPEDVESVSQFYQDLDRVSAPTDLSAPLPLVITSMDWPTEERSQSTLDQKQEYLIGLKRALSSYTFEWVTWRRLNDLPSFGEFTPCNSALNEGHHRDYCFAGVFDELGQGKSVWEEFIKAP